MTFEKGHTGFPHNTGNSGKGTYEEQIARTKERLDLLQRMHARKIARRDPRGSKLYSLSFALQRIGNLGEFDEEFMKAVEKCRKRVDEELEKIAKKATGGKADGEA